jgi:hypothetical protein
VKIRVGLLRVISVATVGGLAMIAVSCSKGDASRAALNNLRWLEGSWRGSLPKGGYFYERYAFVDDSTIAMRGFADSTFSAANDSASIVLRAGKVYDRGASAEWVATHLDPTTIEFSPGRGASNSFTWRRDSKDAWTATLKPRNGAPTIYNMQRFTPSP